MKQRVIALGFFDGVHLGHGALLRRTVEEARSRGCTAAVFTFDRLPREVVTGIPCPLINSPADRSDLLQRLYGIDEVLMVPFDQSMMNTEWDAFVTDILVERYGAVHLVAGDDHRFGRRNGGTPELLQALCTRLGLGCDIIPEVRIDGTPVSSTHIRALLEQGRTEEAAAFLGHPHQLSGTVRHGNRIGRTIGVPTVNLTVPAGVLTPAHGVYAALCHTPAGVFPAVANVGSHPTVDEGAEVNCETYILGYEGDLYGHRIKTELLSYLRPERRFPDLASLQRAIAEDAEAAAQYIAHLSL